MARVINPTSGTRRIAFSAGDQVVRFVAVPGESEVDDAVIAAVRERAKADKEVAAKLRGLEIHDATKPAKTEPIAQPRGGKVARRG